MSVRERGRKGRREAGTRRCSEFRFPNAFKSSFCCRGERNCFLDFISHCMWLSPRNKIDFHTSISFPAASCVSFIGAVSFLVDSLGLLYVRLHHPQIEICLLVPSQSGYFFFFLPNYPRVRNGYNGEPGRAGLAPELSETASLRHYV